MDNLPIEILWKIFNYIPAQERIASVAAVCSYWFEIIIRDCKFKEKIKYVIYLEDLCSLKLKEKRTLEFYEINSLEFDFVSFIKSVKVTTDDMQIFRFNRIQDILVTHFKHAKELEFCNIHAIPSSFFNAIFKSLKHLEVFKINRCYFTNVETILEVKHLKHLTTFELLNGYYFCDRHLELLGKECPSLSHVWLPDSRAISDSSLISFIKSKRSSLLRLGINGYKVTDVAYLKLFECKNLDTFYVEDARRMTEQGIKVLLKLPKLQNLTVKYITVNRNDHIIDLIQSFTAKNKTLVWSEI